MNTLSQHIQDNAIRTSFEELGLPTTKWENWKYTNVAKFLQDSYVTIGPVSKQADLSALVVDQSAKIVFLNNEINLEESVIPSEITITNANDDILFDEKAPFDLFSKGTAKETSFEVKGEVKTPITIVRYFDSKEAALASSQLQIKASRFSKATFVEVLANGNEDQLFSNTQTTFCVEDGACISHVLTNLLGEETTQMGSVKAQVKKDARFESFVFSLGSKMARNNLHVTLEEAGAHADVHGLFALTGKRHHDTYSFIDHQKEHTTSAQLYKGILAEESRGAFTGRIVVERDAQQVDSTQLNKNLLLSKKAKVDTRPQLEVYADDVKCAHGATIGQMNEEEVFYLESRGISKARAQNIICHAFASDVLSKISNERVIEFLEGYLESRFEAKVLNELN